MYDTKNSLFTKAFLNSLYKETLYYNRVEIQQTEHRHNTGVGKNLSKRILEKAPDCYCPTQHTGTVLLYYILLQGCTPRKLTAQCVHLRKKLHFTFFGKAQIYTLFSIVSSEWWFYQFLFVVAAIYPNKSAFQLSYFIKLMVQDKS